MFLWWRISLVTCFITSIYGQLSPVCDEIRPTTSSQSSTFEDLGAEMALDDNPRTMSHTGKQLNPYWSASFNSESVGDILIYNVQHDCCFGELDGAQVTLTTASGTEEFCGKVKTIPLSRNSAQVYKINCGGRQGHTIKITAQGDTFLHLLEVKIMKKCDKDEKCLDKDSTEKCDMARQNGYCGHMGQQQHRTGSNWINPGEEVEPESTQEKTKKNTAGKTPRKRRRKKTKRGKKVEATSYDFQGSAYEEGTEEQPSLLLNSAQREALVQMGFWKRDTEEEEEDIWKRGSEKEEEECSIGDSNCIGKKKSKNSKGKKNEEKIAWTKKYCNCCATADFGENQGEDGSGEEKDKNGCGKGLEFCDGMCKHVHMCGKSFG